MGPAGSAQWRRVCSWCPSAVASSALELCEATQPAPVAGAGYAQPVKPVICRKRMSGKEGFQKQNTKKEFLKK